MFERLVAIEPVGLNEGAMEALRLQAREVTVYPDTTLDDAEIARRIGGADAALLSYTSRISGDVIRQCPNLRYIGMCCSLYDEGSANVDIRMARERGVVVKGVRDYGDHGVVEFIVSELVRLAHGFGERQWKEKPCELSGVTVGILGMGATGRMTARALRVFEADVCYYSRTRKPEAEAEGFRYLPLDELLETAQIVSCHLNRNVVLLREEEFARLGGGKIVVNTGIGPAFDVPAMERWLEDPTNHYILDPVALDDASRRLLGRANVLCANKGSGGSRQCTERLSRKVLENIAAFWAEQGS